MNKSLTTLLLAGFLAILITCDRDRLPNSPEGGAPGRLVIMLEDEQPKPSLSASRTDSFKINPEKEKGKEQIKLSAVSELLVRILNSSNSLVAETTFTASAGRFQGTIEVTAQNDLKVLCLGKSGGAVERFVMTSGVNVVAGQTTTVSLSASDWTAGYISQITGITPNPSTDGKYTVSWRSVSGATGYVLQEANNSSFTGATTAYSGNSTSSSISGKSTGTYYYRVEATNNYNVTSGWSSSQSVTVSLTAPVLADPGTSVYSGTSYSLNWNSVSGTVNYTLQESTDSLFTSADSQAVSGTSQNFSHTVSSATTYYYRVRANSTAGSSLWSNRVDMTVNPSPYEIVLASIPSGTFQMGSNNGDNDEQPVHTVTLDAFRMSIYEITQGQYQAAMAANPSHFTGNPNLPVEMVSWEEAVTFCNRLSEMSGLEPCYDLTTWKCDFTQNGYRLPTEAEWEYACRAGTTTNYNTGDNESDLALAGWYYGNSGLVTHAVAGKEKNAFGLYDMHGNVWEWCNDWYGNYLSASETNPTGPVLGSNRVIRGGSWMYEEKKCRSADRAIGQANFKNNDLGFRVVRGSFVPPYEVPVLNDPGENVYSGTSYTVSWNAMAGAVSYTIEEAKDSLFSGAASQTVSGTSQSFSHSVSTLTTYYYRVKTNSATGSSGWSRTADIVINPPALNAPVITDPGISVSPGTTYFVGWNNVSGATSYTIEEATNNSFNGAISQIVGSTICGFAHNVTSQTTYYYRVKANGPTGSSGWSNIVDLIVTPSSPVTPVLNDPGSSVNSGTSYTVSWVGVIGATSYTIEEAANSAFRDAVSQTISGTSQNFSHTITSTTSYYYRVKANGPVGSSDWSNVVDIIVNSLTPATPVLNDPGSSVNSGSSYTVSWNSVSGATSYSIEEATDSSFSGAYGFTISGTSQQFSHTVSSTTTYYYRIKANNAAGSSDWSKPVDMIINPVPPPVAPVVNDPGSSVNSGSSYTVSWNSVSGAVSYTIEEAINSSFSGASSQNFTGTSTSFNHAVSVTTTYYYRVKANGASVSSGWSNTVDILINPTAGDNAADWNGTWVASQGAQSYIYNLHSGESWTISNATYNGSVLQATVKWFSTSANKNVDGTLEYNPIAKTLVVSVPLYSSLNSTYMNVTFSSSTLSFSNNDGNYSLTKQTQTPSVNASDWNGTWVASQGAQSYVYNLHSEESWTISNATYNGSVLQATVKWFSTSANKNVDGTLEYNPVAKTLVVSVPLYSSLNSTYMNVTFSVSTLSFTNDDGNYSLTKQTQTPSVNASDWNGTWVASQGAQSYVYDLHSGESWTISNAIYNGGVLQATVKWFSTSANKNVDGTLEYNPVAKTLVVSVPLYSSLNSTYMNVTFSVSTLSFSNNDGNYSLTKQ